MYHDFTDIIIILWKQYWNLNQFDMHAAIYSNRLLEISNLVRIYRFLGTKMLADFRTLSSNIYIYRMPHVQIACDKGYILPLQKPPHCHYLTHQWTQHRPSIRRNPIFSFALSLHGLGPTTTNNASSHMQFNYVKVIWNASMWTPTSTFPPSFEPQIRREKKNYISDKMYTKIPNTKMHTSVECKRSPYVSGLISSDG